MIKYIFKCESYDWKSEGRNDFEVWWTTDEPQQTWGFSFGKIEIDTNRLIVYNTYIH